MWKNYWYEQLDADGYTRHQWFLVKQDFKEGFVRI